MDAALAVVDVKDLGDRASLSRKQLRRIVVGVGVGNYLEYFDWGLYGFFAPVIGAQFFPGDDPTIQLLSVLGIFAVGFFSAHLGVSFLGLWEIVLVGGLRLQRLLSSWALRRLE